LPLTVIIKETDNSQSAPQGDLIIEKNGH